MRLIQKSIRWLVMISIVGAVAGCAGARGNYCDVAQSPFWWQSDTEYGATPERVKRYVIKGNERHEQLCN